jgi:hypothetical protein
MVTTIVIKELNSTDANDLLSIGDNCPLLGGVAVYKARSLYQLLVVLCSEYLS